MKRVVFKIVLLLLCCITMPNKIFAEEWYKGQTGCSYSEINTLRTLASAVKFEVKYLGNKRKDEYGIQITNASSKLQIIMDDKLVDTSQIIDNLYPSTKVSFNIIVKYGNACTGMIDITKSVTIPTFNYYYDEKTCEGLSDLDVCNPNYDSSKITKEEFDKIVEDFKNKDMLRDDNSSNKFSMKYLFIVILCVILVLALIFLFRKKGKNKKFI